MDALGVFAQLDRHEALRARGIPQVSLLCGPLGRAPELLRSWLRGNPRPVVVHGDLDLASLECEWLEALLQRGSLATSVLQLVQGSADRGARSARDVEVFLDAALEAVPVPLQALCRQVATRIWERRELSGEVLVSALDVSASQPRQPVWAYHSALELPSRPAVLLIRPSPNLAWLERAARFALSILDADRGATVAIATTQDLESEYFRSAPESRAKALLREGRVHWQVESTSGRTPEDEKDELKAEAPVDAARSEAERYLFAALESDPLTSGQFVLNGTVAVPTPRGRAEVDLLSEPLGIAIELDGTYFHLRDVDAYRRDRRKDLALQRAGFIVLRFRSEEVVSHQEEIWESIRAVVAERS